MMHAVFNQAELLVLLRDFYELTGLRTVVLDAYGVDVLSYPAALPRYCTLVRSVPEGETGCHLCDQTAARRATKEKRTIIYPCHAGLIEVISPILVEGATVGYLLLSHIVQGEDEIAEWRSAEQCCSRYGLPADKMREAWKELPRTPYRILRAAGDLLALAAQSIYKAGLARLVPGSQQEQLSNYLAEHLNEDLRSDVLCKALHISRTGMYNLSMQTFGCGITEQTTRLRMQKAMEYLADTNLSIAEVCERIGIHETDYFYRIFHKHTGLTPRQYRASITATPIEATSQSITQPGENA